MAFDGGQGRGQDRGQDSRLLVSERQATSASSGGGGFTAAVDALSEGIARIIEAGKTEPSASDAPPAPTGQEQPGIVETLSAPGPLGIPYGGWAAVAAAAAFALWS